MKRWVVGLMLGGILSLSFGHILQAEEMMDNSFLIEEAYNQDDGVVQSIQTFQYMHSNTWQYTFTQEWPVPTIKHQLSYAIDAARIADVDPAAGWGDIMLNYRYQVLWKDPVAFAPRISLILPIGDPWKGRGFGATGVQGNLPLSVKLSDQLVTHWNLGMTYVPGARELDGARVNLTACNYGGSLIWLARDNFNLMLEAVGTFTSKVRPGDAVEGEYTFFVNPGMRYAFNFESGLQIVPGLAMPIGLGPSGGQYGIFLYLSFEGPVFQAD
jgi:hypothetical protein